MNSNSNSNTETSMTKIATMNSTRETYWVISETINLATNAREVTLAGRNGELRVPRSHVTIAEVRAR